MTSKRRPPTPEEVERANRGLRSLIVLLRADAARIAAETARKSAA